MNKIQNNQKIKNNILDKIKKGEVHKKSPFYFLVKNYFFWLMFIVSIIIGAISFSSFIIHFIIEPGPWHKLALEQHNFSYIFKALPVLWLIIILIFILIAWFNYKNTKKAYKKHNFLIVSASIILSLILGMILLFSGIGRKFDQGLRQYIPGYEKYSETRQAERKAFLESQGLDPEDFMKHRRLRKFCRYQMK